MLKVLVPAQQLYNPNTNEFIYIKEQVLQLEHSLVSLSKWEQKWHIPFLKKQDKTREQANDYIRCMCMTPNVDPFTFDYLPESVIKEIDEYIANPMTATTFSDDSSKGGSKEILTSEVIYWQMITLGIPVEFQKWHLNRLLTLIHVCNIKSNPDKKKMSKADIARRNRELNKARREANHSAG